MPCPAVRFEGGQRSPYRWQNWSGNARQQVERFFEPQSLADLVWVVQQAEREVKSLHVVGGGYSLNSSAQGQQWMVDLRRLNRQFDRSFETGRGRAALTDTWAARLEGEGNRRLVHVEAGARLFDICQSWTPLSRVTQVAIAKGDLVVRSSDHKLFRQPLSGGEWHLFGHANDLSGMTASGDHLIGVADSGLYVTRHALSNDLKWDVDGRAPPGITALAATGDNVYAVDNRNGLHRRPVGNGAGWRRIGHAGNVAALAASGDMLFCATHSNLLCARQASGMEENWRQIGHANDVATMAAANGRLYAVTKHGRLGMRSDALRDENWQDQGSIPRGDPDLALPTLGGFLGQTIAGAMTTSTHGSDLRLPPLPDLVHAMHVVGQSGQEFWLERRTRPLTDNNRELTGAITACRDLRIIRDDDLFNMAVVDMGRSSIVYSMVIEACSAFRLGEFVEEHRWSRVKPALASGKDRIRSIEWEEIGRIEDVTALTGNETHLFAATRDNRLLMRVATDGPTGWVPIGHANEVIALAATATDLYAVTTGGLLAHRRVSTRNENWSVVTQARGVTSLCLWGNRMFAATKDKRLIRRTATNPSSRWLRTGHANDVIALASRFGRILALTKHGRLGIRSTAGNDRKWDAIGHMPGLRHIATVNGRIFSVFDDGTLKVGKVAADPFDGLNALLGPPPERFDVEPRDYRYLDVIFSTRDPDRCWVRRRWEVAHDRDVNMAGAFDAITHVGLDPHLRGKFRAVAASLRGLVGLTEAAARTAIEAAPLPPELKGIAHAIFSIFGGQEQKKVLDAANELDLLSTRNGAVLGDVLAVLLNLIEDSVASDISDELVNAVNTFAVQQVEDELLPGTAEAEGRIGINWAVSAGMTDPARFGEVYKGQSIEVIFAMNDARYVDYVQRVLDEMMNRNQAGYVALRFSNRSDALLSMYNIEHDLGCAIEVTSLASLSGNESWFRWLHQNAVRLGGRPHWGQFNELSSSATLRLYGDALTRWRDALLRLAGTRATFSNNFTREKGLER